jgi:hypothetical protein
MRIRGNRKVAATGRLPDGGGSLRSNRQDALSQTRTRDFEESRYRRCRRRVD